MFPNKILFAFALALVAPCAAFAAPARPILDEANAKIMAISTRGAATHQRLTLPLDKAAVVKLDADARDVLVSNPDLVDAVVRTPRRIFLLATKVGQTNVFFFDAQGKQILALDIRVEKDVLDLSGLMKMAMPNSAIRVQAMNDNVVLTGSVSSALEATRAADLAARFTGDAKKVVNMINIAGGQQVMLKVRIAEMNRNVAKQFGIDLTSAAKAAGIPGVISTSNPFGLVGKALSDLSGAQVGQVCSGQFFPNTTSSMASSASTALTGAAGVIGTLTGTVPLGGATSGSVQTVINPITGLPVITGGVSSNATPGVFNGGSNVTANAANNLATSSGTSSSSTTSIPCSSANNAQGTLKALEQIGLVHMLAEPNLTAVSGETANFLAGGEFPVPISRDRDGNVTVQFKQFGVGLSFTPVVLAPGRISLQLSSEVSELTNTGSFIAGSGGSTLAIPALAVRRTATTIELPSGGSFAVAGLMQHNTKQVIDGFPGVKDLPVLGALFRSRDFADNQTELVVLVSAYLVEPNAESAFSAPTDGFIAPTDPETLLLGRLNATYKKKDEKPVVSQASAPVGFVVR
ncbi:MAG TPA: type II and III secretion system protein family protein [Rhizomicrobium sp.]|nr:type II and III secretion system protein family protein [Rhizomicrobium sp.]